MSLTPYYQDRLVTLYHGKAEEILPKLEPESVDLTVTSPPYDTLREYNGYSFDFHDIAHALASVTKQGGIVVWIVNDQSNDFKESLTSFKHVIYFVECAGMGLLDTMIYEKSGAYYRYNHRSYPQAFEYMFVLSKGRPKTFNPIRDRVNRQAGKAISGTVRNADGSFKSAHGIGRNIGDIGMRTNVWTYNTGFMLSTPDVIAYEHPAIFPDAVASDHIRTWSNAGDVILDPMCGSGTVGKMARLNGNPFIGIDVSERYCEIAAKRMSQDVFDFQPA